VLIAETALRLAVLGARAFLADGFNQLDLLVSAVSLADVAVSAPCRFLFLSGGGWCDSQSQYRSPTALRTLRLVNVLRLLRAARSQRFPMFELIKLTRSAWILVPVLLFIAYVFALIGYSGSLLSIASSLSIRSVLGLLLACEAAAPEGAASAGSLGICVCAPHKYDAAGGAP
jgi:hypothetical protein